MLTWQVKQRMAPQCLRILSIRLGYLIDDVVTLYGRSDWDQFQEDKPVQESETRDWNQLDFQGWS